MLEGYLESRINSNKEEMIFLENGKLIVSKTIKIEYDRNILAEHICWLAMKHGMFIYGEYVRDKYIFNLPEFENIEIVYFSDKAYNDLLDDLKFDKFIFYINKFYHLNHSDNIDFINTLLIDGRDSITFPAEFKINILFTKSKGPFEKWLNTMDSDFSCNLFYLSTNGITMRYDPKLKFRLPGPTDFFSFYWNMTLRQRFYITTEYCTSVIQLKIILYRAEKLINKGWKMYNHYNSPFYIGIYKEISIEERETCPICLEKFKNKDLIVNTKCRHSYCKDCFLNTLNMVKNNNNCPECSFCRTKFSLNF